jgi:hypothetical protein
VRFVETAYEYSLSCSHAFALSQLNPFYTLTHFSCRFIWKTPFQVSSYFLGCLLFTSFRNKILHSFRILPVRPALLKHCTLPDLLVIITVPYIHSVWNEALECADWSWKLNANCSSLAYTEYHISSPLSAATETTPTRICQSFSVLKVADFILIGVAVVKWGN